MKIINEESYHYVWRNFKDFESIFSQKAYKVLLSRQDNQDNQGFIDTLEFMLDLDKELLNKIENHCKESEMHSMTISEVIDALEIKLHDNFTENKSYIERALYFIDAYRKEDEVFSDLANNLAKLYFRMGLYKKAKPLYLKSVEIREELLGKGHIKTAESYHNLAQLHLGMGQYKKSKDLFSKALIIRKKLLGEVHLYTINTYIDLARSYNFIGNYKKSKSLFNEILDSTRNRLKESISDKITCYSILSFLFFSINNYKKSEPLYKKSLKIREEILGENHPDTAQSYFNLALLYYSTENYKKSEPLYKKSLKIREEILGENHPDTASSYFNLALLYCSTENYKKSEPLYKKSLKIREEILGENHPDTASSYFNLALLYYKKNDYKKSELLYLKSIEIREGVLGRNHLDTAKSYFNLALLYYPTDYKKSKPLYLKSIAIKERILGKNHPDTAKSYNNLAVIYEKSEDYDKSRIFYLKALKIIEESPNYYDTDDAAIYHRNYDRISQKLNKVFFLNKNNSKLTLKLNKIKILTFKQYKLEFEMGLSPKINIIIGQNAVGKTTLLQAITLGLLKENSPDEETRYAKYITKGEVESKIILSHNNYEKTVKIFSDRREIDNNYFIPFILAYGSSFFADYKESDPIVQKMLDEEITSDFAHTIFLEHTDKFWNPLSILRNLAISKHKKSEEKKDIILNTLNKFLSVEDYQLVAESDDNSRFHFIKNNQDKTVLDLSELSEGYRGNVLLITDMLIKILGVGWTPKTIEGIVLIDEFDRHLHPKWQSQLVNILLESFPKIQFIMTTHNPMSILDRKEDEVIILKETPQGIKAITGRGTETIDVSTVLLEYFGVTSTISASMSKKIDRFNQLKLKKELSNSEQKQLNELEEFLGSTVASNFIYDRKYLRFLEYIKDHKDIDFDRYQAIDETEMQQLLEDFGDFFND